MFRCRLIRSLVKLALVVVMTIQPGMALVFANDCGANGASGFQCEGCGCCEVSTPTEKCCCCSGLPEGKSSGSCCMESAESSGVDEFSDTDCDLDAGETLELKVIVLSTTESAVAQATPTPDDNQVASGCQCGFESQPIGDSSPMRRTVEQRDSVAVRFADLATIFGDAIPRPPRFDGSEETLSPPHFSQIHLCIWRL